MVVRVNIKFFWLLENLLNPTILVSWVECYESLLSISPNHNWTIYGLEKSPWARFGKFNHILIALDFKWCAMD